VLASSLAAGIYFSRLHARLFMATLATAVITLFFSIIYSISEIEPYLIPIYMMLIVWLGLAAVAISTSVAPGPAQSNKETNDTWMPPPFAATVLLAIATLGAIVVQYPQQDRSRDYMAAAFVRNTFSGLPDNSILITDYWDFYAPTYYLQHVKGERPDISVIDMSLLVYPWYAEQLRQYDPELLSKSEDLLSRYASEQSKWIEGQQYNESLLTSLYSELLTSFVERNPQRRAYVLFSAPCNESQAPQGCAGNQVAPAFGRLPSGLALELVKPEDRSVLPAFPEYDLRGITSERIHLDDAACLVARYYGSTYERLSRLYNSVSLQEQASKATEKTNAITAVLQSSATCRRVDAALR